MIVAIVGSRNFDNYELFSAFVNTLSKKITIDMIVSGGAAGVDLLAYKYAVEYGITFVCHPPKMSDGVPAAYHRRNLRIVEMSDLIVAFPMGASHGTRHTIKLAKKLKKQLRVFEL